MAGIVLPVLLGAAGGVLGTLLCLWIANAIGERRQRKLAEQLREERSNPPF